MPEFGSPFAGLTKDKKLTNEELIRAIRFVISAEYEATQMYMQIAESSDNELVTKVLKAVADEERVHAGEFLKLLHEIAPDEAKYYEKGEKEVEDIAKEKVEESKTFLSDTLHLSPSLEAELLLKLIDEKKATADDFNRFINETSPTSINKRVQRQMRLNKTGPQFSSPGRKVDDKTDHSPADHNDPTTTPRGKSALRRQIKHNKAHPDQFREAIEFLQINKDKPLSECKLDELVDRESLHKLVIRLAQRPNQFNREWLVGLSSLIQNR